jgi:predicted nucleic acid-binding protein
MFHIRSMGEKVEIRGDLHVVAADPDDDKFLECALVGGASYIVSSDHHLRDLKEYEGIKIISVQEFLTIVRAQS